MEEQEIILEGTMPGFLPSRDDDHIYTVYISQDGIRVEDGQYVYDEILLPCVFFFVTKSICAKTLKEKLTR